MTEQKKQIGELKYALILMTIGFIVLAVALFQERATEPIVKLVPFIDPNYVMPPCEAQRRLKDQGFYQGRIDNIWGPKTSKAYANWSAAPEFEGR